LIAYADTSFLASLYGTDANSQQAVHQIETLRPTFLVTPFAELELITAFEARAFRKLLSAPEVDASMHAFRADLAMGVLSRKPIPQNTFVRAILLSQLYTRTLGSRTLDILQVAIALELDAEVFFTFDKDQAKLAKRAGLAVRPGVRPGR
jgi:predicted nucleic acid-binding protein